MYFIVNHSLDVVPPSFGSVFGFPSVVSVPDTAHYSQISLTFPLPMFHRTCSVLLCERELSVNDPQAGGGWWVGGWGQEL